MKFNELLSKTKTAFANLGGAVADVADDVKDGFLDLTNLRTVRERLVDTMLEATKDGHLSAEELTEFKQLQAKLDINDADMKDIKLSVIKEVIKRATADGKVTGAEMELITELQRDLEIPEDGLKSELDLVKAMFTA